MNWLMGSLADRSWDHVFLVFPFVVIGGVILIFHRTCARHAVAGRNTGTLSRCRSPASTPFGVVWDRNGGGGGDVGCRCDWFYRTRRTTSDTSLDRISAEPRDHSRRAGRSGASPRRRYCDSNHSSRAGTEARRFYQPDRDTVFLLACREVGKDGTVTGLELSSVVVRRGGRNIVDDVSLSARTGEFIALVGGNGAGKSTLLSVIAGLMKPDHGAVTLNGRGLSDYRGRDLARMRAYLPQNPTCEWPISVERLVALGLTPSLPAIGKIPDAHISKIAATLEVFDLNEHRDQPATTLSGGELTRAMLARALVGDPQLLFVDEPIAGLDPTPCPGYDQAIAAAYPNRKIRRRFAARSDLGRAFRDAHRGDA